MRTRFPLVAGLFLVSGATGLLYEVAFSKMLGYIFGATAYAVSTVLASFMGGLALGAHFGGRHAGKTRRPLAAYGVLEIVVGLICACTPAAFSALTEAYVGVARAAPGSLALLTIARAALTGLVVVVPTIAMGATLPLLSRVVAGAHGPRRLSLLYAINTAGGALGALAGAYSVLPLLGIRGAMMAAAITNIVLGVIAIGLGLRGPAAPPVVAEDPAVDVAVDAGSRPRDVRDRLLLALAFVSGFLVFAAEIVEVHLLALLIGNSAYAFGLMLAVFLVCLLVRRRACAGVREEARGAAVPRALAYAALSTALMIPLWDQLPRFFAFAGKHVDSWAGREFCRAFAAIAILIVPTLWMGTTFPLLLQRVASRADVASRVGRLTVANTVGTIVGPIVTGYAVLPLLGSQRTLAAVATAFAVAAALAARALGRAPASVSGISSRPEAPPAGSAPAVAGSAFAGQRGILVLGGAAILLAVLLPRWDLARLTNGANVYFTHGPPPDAIEFVREDVHGGVTTVARSGAVRTMYTNGKFQGDDGGEMTAQRRFAHFPSLFVDHPRERALVIGLGTGTTLGTIAAYPWSRIDAVEISPAIVEAARTFYGDASLHALDDPRVVLHVNDGRNVLLVATEPYDLITMELSSVWFAGASSLYSREFYELCKSRLAKDGVLQQWVQLHHLRRRELAVIVRTLHTVFEHVALFVGGSQGILVASDRPLVASAAQLRALEGRPSIQATLAGKSLESMLDEMVASGPDLERFVTESADAAEGAPMLSTDDNLYLEYATPKGNVLDYHQSLDATIRLLDGYRTPDARARHLGP